MSFSNAKGDDSHGYWPSDHDVFLGLRSERPMLCVLVQRNRPRLIIYSAASRMALLPPFGCRLDVGAHLPHQRKFRLEIHVVRQLEMFDEACRLHVV
jgi:hypothetical protein